MIIKYGEAQCRTIFNSLENTLPHREQKLRVSKFMTDYINSLGLDSLEMPSQEEPPTQSKRQRCILSYNSNDPNNVWQTPLLEEVEDKTTTTSNTPGNNTTDGNNTTSIRSNPTTITTHEHSETIERLKVLEKESKAA